MKILVFSDSLALPRTQPESCPHELTWPQKLRTLGHEVCLCAIGGATIDELFKQTFYFQQSNEFELVLIQSGIVDCAPRFARKIELKILRSIPWLGPQIIKRLNTPKLRKFRNLSYTPAKRFEKMLDNFESCFEVPVFFIEILPAHPDYEKNLPGITQRIAAYNLLIRKKSHITMEKFPSEGLMSDYHHLNALGHQYIVDSIINIATHESL